MIVLWQPRCVIVRLERKISPPIILTLDKVFTFGKFFDSFAHVKEKLAKIKVCVFCTEWATDETLFYTTLEGLRCSRVFRVDLTSSGSRITSVYEETQPE